MPDKILGLNAELRLSDRLDHTDNRFLTDVVVVVLMMIINIIIYAR